MKEGSELDSLLEVTILKQAPGCLKQYTHMDSFVGSMNCVLNLEEREVPFQKIRNFGLQVSLKSFLCVLDTSFTGKYLEGAPGSGEHSAL